VVSHLWGDEDVDWRGIDEAAEFIGEGLRKWRVNVTQFKEKFGTVRVYCGLGISDLHQLTHPGYCFRQWPVWAWKWVNCSKGGRGAARLLNWFVLPLHKWVYRWYYVRAVKKWPHLREEILCVADHDGLLKGV